MIDQFLKESEINKHISAQQIYGAYREWCQRNHFRPVTIMMFSGELRRAGFDRLKIGGQVYYERQEVQS